MLENLFVDFDFGYPTPQSLHWFGLWSPVLNCFIMVHHNLDLLEKVRMLGTSKLMLKTVKISVDESLNNKLDNQCCDNWTIESIEKVDFGSLYRMENQDIPMVSVVLRNKDQISTCETDVAQDVLQVKSWFMFLLKWTKILEMHRNKYTDFLAQVVGYYSEIPEIYRILLLEEDPKTAEKKIKNLLETANTQENLDLLRYLECL
jgi:hypothetical protein